MPQVFLSERARRDLMRLAAPYRDAVVTGIDQLAADPQRGKPLRGDVEGYRSLRIGSYRIVYTFDRRASRVDVRWIRHRKEAYR